MQPPQLEPYPQPQIRPIVQKAPMGWPEAMTRIAYYATWAVIFAGWPKIVKQVKAKIAEDKTDDSDDKKPIELKVEVGKKPTKKAAEAKVEAEAPESSASGDE